MAENSTDEFSFAVKCVLGRFSYRQIKGKDVLVLQPTAPGKSVVFQSFPLVFDAALMRFRNQSDLLVVLVVHWLYYLSAQLAYAGPSQVSYFNLCKSN